MKPTIPIASIDCRINGTFYKKGKEVNVKNIEELIKLNEKGFIEPLTMAEIQNYFKKPEIKKILRNKEE